MAFVTDGTIAVDDGDIAFYNSFVQSQAESSGTLTENWEVQWFAIARTRFAAARDNALVEAPVFLLDSAIVASGFGDLWDGSLQNAISIT